MAFSSTCRIVSWAVVKFLGNKVGIRKVNIKRIGMFRLEGVCVVFDRGKIEEIKLVSVGLSGSLRAFVPQCSSVHRIKLDLRGLKVSATTNREIQGESNDSEGHRRKAKKSGQTAFSMSPIFLRMMSVFEVSLVETKFVLCHGVSTHAEWKVGPLSLSGGREGDTGTGVNLAVADSLLILESNGMLSSFDMKELSVQALTVEKDAKEILISGSLGSIQAVLLSSAVEKQTTLDFALHDFSLLARFPPQILGSSCRPQGHLNEYDEEKNPGFQCCCQSSTLKLSHDFEICRLEEVSITRSSEPASFNASIGSGEVRLTDMLLQELLNTMNGLSETLGYFLKSSERKDRISTRPRTKLKLKLSTGKLIYGRTIPLGSSGNEISTEEFCQGDREADWRRVASFATVECSDLGIVTGHQEQVQTECKLSALVVSAHHQALGPAIGASGKTAEAFFALFSRPEGQFCSYELFTVQRLSYQMLQAGYNNKTKTAALSGEQISASWDADSSILAELIAMDVKTMLKGLRGDQKSNKTKLHTSIAISFVDVSVKGVVGGGVLPSLNTRRIESKDLFGQDIEMVGLEVLLDGEEVIICSKATIQPVTPFLQPSARPKAHSSDNFQDLQDAKANAKAAGESDSSFSVSPSDGSMAVLLDTGSVQEHSKPSCSSDRDSLAGQYVPVVDACAGDTPLPPSHDERLSQECHANKEKGQDNLQHCKVIAIKLQEAKVLLPLRMMLRDKIDDIETQIKAFMVSRKSVLHHDTKRHLKGADHLTEKPGIIIKLCLAQGATFEIQQDSFEAFLQEQKRNLDDAKALEKLQRELKKDKDIHSTWEHFYSSMERWRRSSASRGWGQGSLLRVVIREGYVTITRGSKGQHKIADYCTAIRNLDKASQDVLFEGEPAVDYEQCPISWTESAPKQLKLHGLLKDAEVYVGGSESQRFKCTQISCKGVIYIARLKLSVPPSSSMATVMVGAVGRAISKQVPAKGARPPVKTYSDIEVDMKGFNGHFAQMDLVTYADLARETKRLSKSSTRVADGEKLSPPLPWWDVMRYLWHGRLRIMGEDITMALSPHKTQYGSLTMHTTQIDLQSFFHGHWAVNLEKLKVYRLTKGLSSQSWNLGEIGASSPLLSFPKATLNFSCQLTRADGEAGEMHHIHLSAIKDKLDRPSKQKEFIDKSLNCHLPVSLFDHFRTVHASACVLVNVEPDYPDCPDCCLHAADLKWTIDFFKMLSKPPRIIREASKRRKFGSGSRRKRHPLAVGSPLMLIESLDLNLHVRSAEVTFHDDNALAATMHEIGKNESAFGSPAQGLRLAFETTSYSGRFLRHLGASQRPSLCPAKTCISSSAITLKLPPYIDSDSSCKADEAHGSECLNGDPEDFAKLFDRLRKGQEAPASPPKRHPSSADIGGSFVLATELLICNILHRQQSNGANAATDVVIDGLKAVWTKKTWDAIWCCFGSIYGNLCPKILGQGGRNSSAAGVHAQASDTALAPDRIQTKPGRESLLSLLVDGKTESASPLEEEKITLLVTVNQPQVTLDSEEGHGRILLSAAGGLLVRKKIVSTDREVGESEQHKLSLSLEYVQMHVIPLDVDPSAGLLWLVSDHQLKGSAKGAPLRRSTSLTPPTMSRSMFVPILSPCHMQLCHAKDVCAVSGRRISHQLTLSSPEIQSTTSCRDFQALISVISKLVIAAPPSVMMHAQLVREAGNTTATVLRHRGLEKIDLLMVEDHQSSNQEVIEAFQSMQDSFLAFKGTLQTEAHLRSKISICKSGEAAFHRITFKDGHGVEDENILSEASIVLSETQSLLANSSGKLQKLAQNLCNSYRRFRRLALRGQLAPNLSLSFDFSQVDWILTGPRGDEVGATLTSLSFVRLREEDGAAVSRFKIGSLTVKNLASGNLILSPLLKGASWRRDAAIRVFAEVAPPSALDPSPVKDVQVKAVYDHLEVNVMPHEICLEESIAEFLQSFFLPDATSGTGSMVNQTDTERKSLLLPASKRNVGAGKKHKISLSLNDADFQANIHRSVDSWDPQAVPGSSTARPIADTHASNDSGPSLPARDSPPHRRDMPTLFRYVKVDALSVQVSYTGAPISIHELKLVADARLYHNFLGTGQELLQRVKWDWTKSVLRSVAGLQHRKFRQLVPNQAEVTSTTRASPRRKRDAAVHSFLETDEEGKEAVDTPQSPDEKKAWLLFGHRYKGKR
eukprot:scaffold938_cov334-Pavlova_lutheri.AAC.59